MTTPPRFRSDATGGARLHLDGRDNLKPLAVPILEIDGRRFTGRLDELIKLVQSIEHADTARSTVLLHNRPIAAAPKSEADLARDLKARLTSGWVEGETTDDVAAEAPISTPTPDSDQTAALKRRLAAAWERDEEI